MNRLLLKCDQCGKEVDPTQVVATRWHWLQITQSTDVTRLGTWQEGPWQDLDFCTLSCLMIWTQTR